MRRRCTRPVDEKNVPATAAERAGLSTEEAQDLTRATLGELGGQLSSGELRKLVPRLPNWLTSEMRSHERSAQPITAGEYVRQAGPPDGAVQHQSLLWIDSAGHLLQEDAPAQLTAALLRTSRPPTS